MDQRQRRLSQSSRAALPISDDLALRISEAMDHLDQANTIFNYVMFSISGVTGVGDPEWDYKFVAMTNVSRIIDVDPDDLTENVIHAASREIALVRLPRLLCISLVSSLETCLEDISVSKLKSLIPKLTETQLIKEVRSLTRGGPLQYLPRLAQKLQIDYFSDSDWNEFIELVATRNVLVHQAHPSADEQYVRNAGPSARASIGKISMLITHT